jgi:hypothetical protein
LPHVGIEHAAPHARVRAWLASYSNEYDYVNYANHVTRNSIPLDQSPSVNASSTYAPSDSGSGTTYDEFTTKVDP